MRARGASGFEGIGGRGVEWNDHGVERIGKHRVCFDVLWVNQFSSECEGIHQNNRKNQKTAIRNKKLLGTSASLLVTSALLVVTMFAIRNNNSKDAVGVAA